MSAVASVHHEAQTNTGWSNAKFGLVLFIVSEAVIFGALFAHYFYNRVFSASWPPVIDGVHIERVPVFPLPLILTVVLLSSAWTCHNAVTAIQRDRQVAMLGWLSATIALGVLFLAGQAFEYTTLFLEGITPFNSLYGTTFFGLTGMHGMHVLAGLGVLTAMYVRGLSGQFSSRHHFGLEGATLYWHFVDAVWIALLLAVYIF